jgi:hypothetical protein
MGLIPTEALMKKVSQAAFQHIFDSGLLFFDLAKHSSRSSLPSHFIWPCKKRMLVFSMVGYTSTSMAKIKEPQWVMPPG